MTGCQSVWLGGVMIWLIELFVASPATPILVLAIVGCAAYLLGVNVGAGYYYDPQYVERPTGVAPVASPSEEEPVLYLPPVEVVSVLPQASVAEVEETISRAEARALAAEAEAKHQEELKERHIKEKRELRRNVRR